MKKIFYYETKIGKIGIVQNNENITNIYTSDKLPSDGMEVVETPLILKAANQLKDYLEGKRKSFDFSIEPEGTEFQKKVWKELQNTPYGETLSYKDIAEKIGNPKASRAIGMANNKNPILIIIPCHRIIGKNGKLVGYAAGLDMKKQLLEMEKENKND
ncbi:methylated-DNA--[protein]-cysteine S-methyltransferase [Clostridium sp. CCUG 7971]|uniref:methylated-DNA--[protein]-cysteine S-methyltransferase n=1 Tax=Clostridium sp. CCUG 7971 TaxID=2811414 RepID=UPI001ABAA95E|nr:methylated-DNA--[protein]-cysteine S-methyltransferase [Clostridium sp. CCUG 7971]MBO3444738.1 methylated-DNA--[protein]-cysteine S-methyltransferase [Clostridium sp. CCUG 7971]